MSGRCTLPEERSLLPARLLQRRTMELTEALEEDRGKQALPADSEGEVARNQVPLVQLVLAGSWLTVTDLVPEGLVPARQVQEKQVPVDPREALVVRGLAAQIPQGEILAAPGLKMNPLAEELVLGRLTPVNQVPAVMEAQEE